jgi:hypothetical protein
VSMCDHSEYHNAHCNNARRGGGGGGGWAYTQEYVST